MNQRLKIINICFVLLLVLTMTGCWDKKEVERKAYVIGIGLDPGEQKGKVNVTYLIANSEVGSAVGSNTEEQPVETVTVRASGFISSRDTANSIISREISYDLLRVILVSEEFAENDEFIRFIYAALKDREIKRGTFLIVTKENVGKYFERNKPRMETRPHKFYQYMIERGAETGIIPESELHHFFRITEEDANAFLAIYSTTEGTNQQPVKENEIDFLAGEIKKKGRTNSTQFIGSAVFLEGKMIGTLTGQETRIALMLNDSTKVEDVLTTFADPFNDQYEVSVRLLKRQKSKVKMNLDKERPQIDIKFPVIVDVLSDYNMTNYTDDKEKVEQLRQSLEAQMEDKIMEVVRKTQEEFQAEFFGWSLVARKQFRTLQEYMEFDWMKTYPKMEINVDVKLRFGEFGRQPELPGYKGIRD